MMPEITISQTDTVVYHRKTATTIKPTIRTLKVEEVTNGEGPSRSPLTDFFYISFLWGVSVLAMSKNLTIAIFIKLNRRIFQKKKIPLWKILWEMGRDPTHHSSFIVEGFSQYNHQGKVFAAGWKSLALFYNYSSRIKPRLKKNLEGLLTRFWIGGMKNRRAVYNRKQMVVQQLVEAFDKFGSEGREVRLLSIASGSAQAVIEAILQRPHLNVKAALIDFDKTAIAESKRLAEKHAFLEIFSFYLGTTKILEKVCADFHPDIIEMVGFLDYRPDDKAINLISRIRKQLPKSGIFLTANIRKNWEMIFLFWVLLWPMIYRNPRKLAKIMIDAGFSPENIMIEYDPDKIHGLTKCIA